MPVVPRGKRKRRVPPARLVLGCPKICPEWELGALRALIKPQYKTAIAHRQAEQKWDPQFESVVREGVGVVGERLGWTPEIHFPDAGDYHFVIDVDAKEIESAKALVVLLSKRLDSIWLTLGRWYVRRGKFSTRHRSHNILFQPASSVHLTRAVRSALKGEL
ncbi:MAG TPA: hypothetical protein VF669_21175 [Tepidisphaeraceae bacterium]|jgi:hypothetical protein